MEPSFDIWTMFYLLAVAHGVFVNIVFRRNLSANRDKKYLRSELSKNTTEIILRQIKSFMEQDKGYLNNDLSLHQLSDELSISANQISHVINELEGCNFHEFVNKYRVEEAKKLLKQDSSRLKIIQIAYLAGFNNKATFNSAFKKIVGIPPSLYRKL
ncbi:MAG: YesN/AraC family two-component response regulator [Marinoscillum sp.]|jgi:YesN/AraC family two-component response regulator